MVMTAPVSAKSKTADLLGEVLLEEYLGDATYVHIKLKSGAHVVVREDPAKTYKIGETVGIKVAPLSIHLFDKKSGKRLGG